jgi:hypothetical protein
MSQPLTPESFYPTAVVQASQSCPGDWRGSADAVIRVLVDGNRCFSSGEIARCLRICEPSLRFSVPGLGEHVRDAFYAGSLPLYNDGQGGTLAAMQHGRTTVGLFPSRTPAGQLVFVYGPEQAACDVHEFEVYIPQPGESLQDIYDTDNTPATPPVPAPVSGQSQAQPVVLTGNLSQSDLTSAVTADCRLYVSRGAFEAYVGLRGQPMRGGDPVYVLVEPSKVTIRLDDDGNPANEQFTLSATRGRVKVPNRTGKPFNPGTRYSVQVTATEIVVDLANPI